MNRATRIEDLVTPDKALSMSGLDYMRGILSGDLPGPPIGATLGYELHAVDAGRVVFRGTPTFDFCNPMGTVHGGWYGTLLDSSMACAVMTPSPSCVAAKGSPRACITPGPRSSWKPASVAWLAILRVLRPRTR